MVPLEAALQKTNPIDSMTLDTMKHTLSFCDRKGIAMISRASKQFHVMICKFYLDTVHDIAWFDLADGCYHIEHICSVTKDTKEKDLMTMTCCDTGNPTSKKQYLLIPQHNAEFEWAMFVAKQFKGRQNLKNSKGHWKILKSDHPKYVSRQDLNKILSLVMHKSIAPKLLNYTGKKDNPFKSKISVCIDSTNCKYDVLFWNGADLSTTNQCSSFQIFKHDSGKTNYYLHFKSHLPHVNWCWYDNNSSRYKAYTLGDEVDAQIECSFQANLTCNFPLSILHCNDFEYFNNANLNMLKKAYVKQFGRCHAEKVFLLRFGFDADRNSKRRIQMAEQITVTDYGFPRSVQRVHDAHKNVLNNFNISADRTLRMQPA